MKRSSLIPSLLVLTLLAAAFAALLTVETAFLVTGLGLSRLVAALLLAASLVPAALFFPALSAVARRMGAQRFLIWAFLLMTLALATAALIRHASAYLAVRTVFVLFALPIAAIVRAAVAEGFRYSRDKALYLSLLAAGAAAGGLLGSVLGGSIGLFDLQDAMFFAATLTGAASLIAMVAAWGHRGEPQRFRPSSPLTHWERAFGRRWKVYGTLCVALGAVLMLLTFLIPLSLSAAARTPMGIGASFAGLFAGAALATAISKRLVERNDPLHVAIAAALIVGVGALLAVLPEPFVQLSLFIQGVGAVGLVAGMAAGLQRVSHSTLEVTESLVAVGLLSFSAALLAAGVIITVLPLWFGVLVTGAGVFVVSLRVKESVLGDAFPRLSWRRPRRY